LPFSEIETQHFGKADPRNYLAWVSLIRPKLRYLAKWFISAAIHLFMNKYPYVTATSSPIVFPYVQFSVKQHIEPGKTYWPILSYFFVFPWFILVSIAVTVINHITADFMDLHVARINLGKLRAALISRCSGLSGASMRLSSSICNVMSMSQSSSLAFGGSKSPFQWSQFSVSEMLSGALSWSLSAGWWLILRIRRTFDIWVCPPGRSFAHKVGGNSDLLDNLNAAAPSCRQFDQDAGMISSISERYPTAVICLLWARDSFCVARRFWLPYHISKKSWTLAILRNFLSSTSFFNS